MAVDYTEEVVEPLGYGFEASEGQGSYGPDSLDWDCTIGGLNFLYATSDQDPIIRETGKFRRERIDTERNPGEQSLDSGLWIRSQASWHYGAGLSSAEPLDVAVEEASYRYYKSGGVDPWTPGQLKLLKNTESKFASAAASQQILGVSTGVLHAGGNVLTYVPTTGTAAAVTWGGTADINSLTTTGQYWLAGDSSGIYRGDEPSGAGTKIYNKAATTVTSSLLRFVKSRLMYGENNKIIEITNLVPTSATLPAELYAHPNSGWIWSDFAEGPTAIYASGYEGEESLIYKIDVTATTTTVTLNVPVVVAEMPRGERILSMYSYVGSFIIIGTSSGCRVASISDNGTLTMGPLVFNSTQVDDAVAYGEYVYLTVRDKGEAGNGVQRAGLYRINLGQTLSNTSFSSSLQFAYAPDLTAPVGTAGEARSVTIAGEKLWFSVNGAGVFRETATYVADGWIETGRIRLGIMENKSWRDLRLIGSNDLQGTVTAYASVTNSGTPSTWDSVISVNATTNDAYGKLNAAAPLPTPNLWLAFRLQSNTGATVTSQMIGYQLRAMPSPRRNELIQIPVRMFDFEKDRQGSSYGRNNGAFDRFSALKQMENIGNTVVFKDHTTGEQVEVYVEQVTWKKTLAPSRGDRKNIGGIVTLLLRSV
jgi:predicted RNA-binding protein with TRAM domain